MSALDDIVGEIEEAGRAHSRFAPSSLKRILACPRSVALGEAIGATASRGSVYAAEGSVAHLVAEGYLRKIGQYNGPSSGDVVTIDGHAITVDADMHNHGADYALYVTGLMVPGDELFVETTVRLDDVVGAAANMYGHLDAAVWSPSRRTLFVVDYKYGRGIRVSALDNDQLKAYALGALFSLPTVDPDEVQWVETHVYQPRVPGASAPDRIATVDLLRWGFEEVEPITSSIAQDGAQRYPLTSGEHCRFCPALSQCPAIRDRALKAAQKAFGAAPAIPAALSDDELAVTIDEADVIEPWFEAVRKEGLARALRGQTIPGRKVVQTRGRRVWNDEKTVSGDLLGLGLGFSEVFEQSVRSPAQIEKKVPAEKRGEFNQLWTTKSSGHSLAPASDPRPGVRVGTAADIFRDASPIPQEQ